MYDIIGQDNEFITEDDKKNVKCVYLWLEPALTKQIQVELTHHHFVLPKLFKLEQSVCPGHFQKWPASGFD